MMPYFLFYLLLIFYQIILIIMTNPYERETENLLLNSSTSGLREIYDISLFSRTKKIDVAESSVEKILDQLNLLDEASEDEQALKSELSFLKAFYRAINNDSNYCRQFCERVFSEEDQIDDEYYLRTLLMHICLKLKLGNNLSEEEDIAALIKCLKRFPEGKNEAVFKLTGCKSLERMQKICFNEIADLTDDLEKRAIKFQIVSDWKYVINCKDESLKMKTEAKNIWKKLNNLSKFDLCSAEERDLIRLLNGEQINNIYVRKLIFIRLIIAKIQESIPENKVKKASQNIRKAAVRFMLPAFLKKLHLEDLPKSKSKTKDSKIDNSMLKKKSVCDERREIGQQFMEHVKYSHFACVEFIPKSKFETNRQKQFVASMGVYHKVYFHTLKDNFEILREVASRKGNLNRSGRRAV